PREGPDVQPAGAASTGRLDDVLAGAARRHQDEDVTGPAVRLHLPSEELAARVVVADRGEARRLGSQADGGEGAPVLPVPAHQLRGQVLGLGGAATVAGGQQPAT